MIGWLCQEYEIIFKDGSGKMSIIRGKVCEYLGITLDYTVHGQVRIIILSYIEEIIKDFNKEDRKGKGTNSSAPPQQYFCSKRGPQETGSGESRGVPHSSGKDFVCY